MSARTAGTKTTVVFCGLSNIIAVRQRNSKQHMTEQTVWERSAYCTVSPLLAYSVSHVRHRSHMAHEYLMPSASGYLGNVVPLLVA